MYDHRIKSSELIVQHLLARAKRPMTPDDVEWISAESIPATPSGDTKAIFRGIGRFSGEYTTFYRRQDINEVVNGLLLTIPAKEYRTSHEVMVEINRRYGFKLEEYEIVKAEYKRQGSYELIITDASPIWKGQFTVYREAAEDSIVRAFDNPATLQGPLVRNAIREKITGDLIYEPYTFDRLREQLVKFVPGSNQEYQIVQFLNVAVGDPWVYVRGKTEKWNVDGAVVKLSSDGAYNVVEFHLSPRCTNVGGYLKFKYLATEIKG